MSDYMYTIKDNTVQVIDREKEIMVKDEVLDYINRNELTGALLLTGQWGCGKSYLMKEIVQELNEKKKAAAAIISLFGLDSVSALNKRVKDEYTNFVLGDFGKPAKKITKAITTITNEGMKVASIASGNPGVAAASQGLSSILNYDLFGFLDVTNTIGKDENARKFVLIFDDLERSNLPRKDLLGALNEYLENKQIRVVIIADEEKIVDDEYKEYKEKLVSRTIRMTANYDTLIDRIIDSYSETVTGYKAYLIENSDLLKLVFTESKSNNLRTFKSAIADFERVYDAWKETGIALNNMNWALYTFTAEEFISKVPRTKESEESKKRSEYQLSQEGEKQYIYKGKKQSSFSAFNRWIKCGVWDKGLFIQELRNKYIEVERTPLERFIAYDFWSLEQKDIDEGLPEAVELAYKGELTRENLISLLTKIHLLSKYSIELPCKIDYIKMEDGLRKRIKRVKNEEVYEPRCHIFTEYKSIDEDAYRLYNMIAKLEDQITTWEYRKQFINYIMKDSDSSVYSCRSYCIDEFDDEFLTVFTKQYSRASNEEKFEYARALLGMVFDSNNYSTEENMNVSRNNFRKLVDWLNHQKSDDGIAMIINSLFAKQIQETELMKKR